MNIIDILKSEAFKAFNECESDYESGKHDWAREQFGRGCAFLRALYLLVGNYPDTGSLVSKMRKCEDMLEQQLM